MDPPRKNASNAFALKKEKPHTILGSHRKSYVVLKKTL